MKNGLSVIEIPAILLRAAGGEIQGKTVLQKLAYFLGVKEGRNLEFAPHFYGPYSRKIEYALDILTYSGDIMETTTQLGVNLEGWPVKETTYALTSQGQEYAESAVGEYPETEKLASDLVERARGWDRGLSPQPLSLAAKVHFLCHRPGTMPSVAELERAAGKVGWKLGERDIRSALELLRHLELVS